MSAKKVTYNGNQYTVPQLAKVLNVLPSTMYWRIGSLGLEEAIKVSLMSKDEFKEYQKEAHYKKYENGRPELWTYEYNGQRYSREALAKTLGVNNSTFQAWIAKYGREKAIEIAEMTDSERKAEIKQLCARRSLAKKANTDDRPSKVDEFETPDYDPDYELKNRIKHWVKHYGAEGAIAKASLRI